MTDSARKTRKLAVILSCSLYAFIYLIFHIPNYVFDPDDWVGTSKDVYLILRPAIEKIVYYLVPSVIATVIFVTESRVLKALRDSLKLSAPVLLYSLPYVYLYGISEGYDTPESIGISLAISAIGLIIQGLHVFLLYMLARVLTANKELRAIRASLPQRKAVCREERKSLWKEALAAARNGLKAEKPLSLEGSGGLGVFAIVFAELCVRLLLELIQTVLFLVTAEGGISTAELLTVLFTYVFLLCEMLLVLAISGLIRNRALSQNGDE